MNDSIRKQETIMFDEDGVCINSEQIAIDTMNGLFGTHHTVTDISYYEWFVDTVRTLKGKGTTFEDARNLLFSGKFISKALPTPGVQKLVTELHELGFQIVKATSRPESQREITLESNAKYFPEVSQIFMNQPQHDKFECKLHAIQKKRPLVFIDDDGDLLYKLQRFVPEGTFLILIDRPWNQIIKDASGKEVFITRDSGHLQRFGFFREDNYEWGRIYARIIELSAQQAK